MSANSVLRRLLSASAELVALVPPARIFDGDAPIGTVMPAISLRSITATPRNTVSMAEPQRVKAERLQVTAMGLTYAQASAVIGAARRAVTNRHGMVGAIKVLSIIPLLDGPDLETESPKIFSTSRDYRITYIE